MDIEKAYGAIRKFVASAVFLLIYIYQVQNSQDPLVISLVGLAFILCLIQGLRVVLIVEPVEEQQPTKVTYSGGEKIDN